MDLEKIGKFIAKKRQDNSYTQESLAEKLNISNRSISKWERGVCLPDANNMAKLCKLFDISYNELLSGEEINQKDYKQHSEKLLEEFRGIVPTYNTSSLDECVKVCAQVATKGDAVLLSPACASFDLFKNYEQRGTLFKQKVLELQKSDGNK